MRLNHLKRRFCDIRRKVMFPLKTKGFGRDLIDDRRRIENVLHAFLLSIFKPFFFFFFFFSRSVRFVCSRIN